ncbi:MAG TPA: hypothetical protein VM029_14400 [Opitutaceae bacterium]|nr:hypothetical protein [Opitutaceae bacterium]
MAAPHPTALMIAVDGALHPMVNVVGTDPIVVIDGKERRIRTSTAFLPERAPRYGDGTVEFKELAINGTAVKRSLGDTTQPATVERLVGGTTFFEAKVIPSAEVRGGFIALVFFEPAILSGRTGGPASQIIVHSLPTLPAGVETPVRFSAALEGMNRVLGCFAHVFGPGGVELRSNFEGIAGQYYARIEQAKLATAIDGYRARFAQADHGAVPVVVIKPLLPAGIAAPAAPVTAIFSVAENGWVSDVSFTGTDDPGLLAALRDSLGGWLFLPRLKSGQPVPTRVQMPLKF